MDKNLEKQLQQQQKLIQYMKKKFKQSTGKEIQLPQTWEKLLNIQQQQAPIIPLQQAIKQQNINLDDQTFAEAVTALNLPSKITLDPKKMRTSDKKKTMLTTNFDPTNKFHMVEVINLSGFKFKKFSKNRFRDFVQSISDMRCLHSLILQNNGIDDSCLQQIETIFNIKRIIRIDLSRNKMDKQIGASLAKILTNSTHIEWLELSISRNSFSFDYVTTLMIINSIKLQTKLFHLCFDIQQTVQGKQKELVANYTNILKTKSNLHSFCPIDTKINENAMKNICYALEGKQHHLTCLSFKFCFLQKNQLMLLSKSLQINRSLIKLDLSNNGLSNQLAGIIVDIFNNNITLVDVNFSKNNLGDIFAKSLSKSLQTNQTLIVVDISMNLIQVQGALSLIQCLTENNDTLQSLGDITENYSMGIYNIQKIKKALRINTVSKELRKKLMNKGDNQEIDPQHVANSHTLAFLEAQYKDYRLVKPIAFTNPIKHIPDIKLWSIR